MFGAFVEAGRRITGALEGLDAGSLVGRDPARALELVCRWERQIAALRTEVAGRVAETRAWSGQGARDEAAWLASRTGTTLGEARSTLDTARRLTDRPVVRDAFAAGELSEPQAREIASVPPGRDPELVRSAPREPLRALRDTCRRLRQAGEDEQARYRRQLAARRASMWRHSDGMGRLEADLPPDRYVRVRAALEAECDRVFNQARSTGQREPADAYRADALVNLICGLDAGVVAGPGSASGTTSSDAADRSDSDPADGSGPDSRSVDPTGPKPPRRHDQGRAKGGEFVVLIDLESLRSGGLVEGGTCEVAGVGPIPVPAALELLDDAFVKAVITSGRDPRLVAHFGRHLPETLRTALLVRDRCCVVPGCANTFRQEVHHHRVPFREGGPLALWNANRVCAGCHDLITHRGYRLTGTPGSYRFHGPEGHLVAADPDAAVDPDAAMDQSDTSSPGSRSSGAMASGTPRQLQLQPQLE